MGILQIEPVSLSGMRFLFSFYGLSETGKTLSALRVAAGLEPDPRKRMLLDTEGGQRGRAYVNEIDGGYLYASLSPPYTPERYIQALNEIEAAGVTVLVTDSASHSWFAEGGVLAMVEESTLKNDMAKWKDPKRRLGKMMQRYRSSDMHHILCSRAKQPLVEAIVDGRKTYVPGPVVPIQEKMMRYDMTVIAHMLGRGAFTLESPQGKCPGNLLPIFTASELMNEETGRRLAEWVNVRATLSPEFRALKVQAAEMAALGLAPYGEFWATLDRSAKAALLAEHDNLKSIAKAADDERERARSDTETEERADRERADPKLDAPFGQRGIELAEGSQPHSPPANQEGQSDFRQGSGDTTDAGTQPAGDTLDAPRDLLGDPPAENLAVPLDRDPDISALAYYGRQMLAMIAERPGDWQRAARIKIANEGGIARLKSGCHDLYQEVQAALAEAPR
jgi:hypothetical protein